MIGSCNFYALRKASRRVSQFYDRVLAPSGLRATQYALLREVERLGPTSLAPLAEATALDRATLGHNIRPLEAQGYVTLTTGEDRRSRKISLTKVGRKALADAKPLWEQAQAIFEEEIGRRESTALRATLHHVARSEFD